MVVINHTNHPVSTWQNEQVQAIKEFTSCNEIVDVAFPQVDPYADEAAILELALDMMNMLNKYDYEYIHLMGEQSYCYVMTNLLKEAGKKVIVSTTKRDIVEKEGKKISIFKFTRFRIL